MDHLSWKFWAAAGVTWTPIQADTIAIAILEGTRMARLTTNLITQITLRCSGDEVPLLAARLPARIGGHPRETAPAQGAYWGRRGVVSLVRIDTPD
jgi:hypothetical protein